MEESSMNLYHIPLSSRIDWELGLEHSASDCARAYFYCLGGGTSRRAGLRRDNLHSERPDGRGFLFRLADHYDKRGCVARPGCEHRGRGNDKEPRWHRGRYRARAGQSLDGGLQSCHRGRRLRRLGRGHVFGERDVGRV